MNEVLDAGDIIGQKKLEIKNNFSAEMLTKKLAALSADYIVKVIPEWIGGKIRPIPQNEDMATYTSVIKKEDGKIDWNEPAEQIYRRYRALFGWPGIFTYFYAQRRRIRLKITKMNWVNYAPTGTRPGKVIEYKKKIAVGAKEGLVILEKVQPEGKKTMDVDEFLRGNKYFLNSVLG